MKRTISLLLALVLLLTLCACGKKSGTGWQEQYDLGVRYLSEENYEEAVIAFTAAIEIDPKRAEAYVGRGSAYIGCGETAENLAAALADYEMAVSLGDKTLDEKIETLRIRLASIEALPLLEELYSYFSANDIESAKNLMRQADYRALSESVDRLPMVYEGDLGTTVAVYANDYYYYGDWQNDQRSGHGLWICAVSDSEDFDYVMYDGSWSDDYPNGEGLITREWFADKIQAEPEGSAAVKTEIKGTFANGLYHGSINEIWEMNDGDILVWTPITAVDGVYQAMKNPPAEIMERDYARERIVEGEYLVAIDENNNGTDLWSDDEVNYVPGFRPTDG